MNWKNLTDKLLPIFFVIFFCLGISLSVSAQENAFSELTQKFEEGAIFKADFQHQSVDSYTQDTVASKGQIWVGEHQYKVMAQHQTVVVNGKTAMVYDENRNRVIISEYEPEQDDFAPSRILNGVDSTFTVQTEKQRGDQIYVRLTSDDPFAIYKKVEIFLSESLIPQKIRAVDPVDNILTTTFEEGAFVNRQEEMFSLEYPEDAEIVDMRN